MSANSTRPNTSTRSPPARSVSFSDSPAMSSNRKSARRKPRTGSRSPTLSRRKGRNCGSTISPSGATPRTSRKRTSLSITCSGRRWRPRIRISFPTPTAIWPARNSSTRISWTTKRSTPTTRPCAGFTPSARMIRRRSGWSTGCGPGSKPADSATFAGSPQRASAPAPMHPYALLRVLAYPSFDHRRDRLHGAGDIDPSGLVAPRLDGFAEVHTEAMLVGETDDARAVNRAFDVAGETGDEGVGFAAAAEERHVDAVDVMLVHEHGDVAAGLQYAQELEWRVEAGGDEAPHAAFAKLDDRVAPRADMGPPVKHRRIEPVF